MRQAPHKFHVNLALARRAIYITAKLNFERDHEKILSLIFCGGLVFVRMQ